MVKISAEDLLRAIGDPSFEEKIAQLISQNPELEQSLDLAIMRIKSKMPIFKNPQFDKSMTEDEVLKFCADEGINMSRKNFRGNYLEKELAKYNAVYFHEDVNAWEFDYSYIFQWVPLLLDEKHELRHKIVLLMQEKSESTVSHINEVSECKEGQEDNAVSVLPLTDENKIIHIIQNPSKRCIIKIKHEILTNKNIRVYFHTSDLNSLNYALVIDFEKASWDSMQSASIIELNNYQEVFDLSNKIASLKENEKLQKKFEVKVLSEIKIKSNHQETRRK